MRSFIANSTENMRLATSAGAAQALAWCAHVGNAIGLGVLGKGADCQSLAGAHSLADGRQRGADLGAVHAQLLAEALQRFQVSAAPLPPAVVRHVPLDLQPAVEYIS